MPDTLHVDILRDKAGYVFNDLALLVQALTHSSRRTDKRDNNERLEFLGDRVLGLVIAEGLYHRFGDANEGFLAQRSSYLVRKETCALVAARLGINGYILTGGGITSARAEMSTRILGDTCEAVIGAIYLDGGFDAARAVILKLWGPLFDQAAVQPKDAKTTLQEWALSRGKPVPAYACVARSGPDHNPRFVMSVTVDGYESVNAPAGSKRVAEQNAARAFIKTHGIAWR